jgi:hypothetical protein
MEKLAELNASALPPLAPAEIDALKQLIDVLQDGRYYHSSTVQQAGVDALAEALLWPASNLLPVLDICRVAVTHPDAAAKLAKSVPTIVHILLSAVAGAVPASLAVAMLAVRTLANMFTQPDTRSLVLADMVRASLCFLALFCVCCVRCPLNWDYVQTHVLSTLKSVVSVPNDPLKVAASLVAYK